MTFQKVRRHVTSVSDVKKDNHSFHLDLSQSSSWLRSASSRGLESESFISKFLMRYESSLELSGCYKQVCIGVDCEACLEFLNRVD
jgi:hypothetical protein